MGNDIYRKLQDQMDQYSVGFPATASGIEIKILQRLFTPEEAGLYLALSLLLEEPASVAGRVNAPPDEIAEKLSVMADKGLIFRLRRGGTVRYAAVPFVVGSYEFQLKNMDRELAEMVEQYFDEAFLVSLSSKTVPMRTVPVNKAFRPELAVAGHEDARSIVAAQKKIVLLPCICRKQQGLLDNPCEKPHEVCMAFGSHADYYVENGMGHFISVEEALEVLDRAEAAGLVHQPFNVVNPGGMCNCCGCCCGVLRTLRKLPKPAEAVCSNYYAVVDPDTCTGCGTCETRCQMEAIIVGDDGIAAVNEDRCIGCGLCVTECPTDAVKLMPVPENRKKTPPATAQDLFAIIAEQRGKSLLPLWMREGGTK
ncbi:MAG: 4Fe-4S binding protein [Thermodesulfobacteriota bacterium]